MTESSAHLLWTQLAQRVSASLSESQLANLDRYLDFLLIANQTMNLTRITERADAERLHIADSLTLLPYLPTGAIRIADVGSGGGVPGLVLAIAQPEASVILIESTKKKAAFLERAVTEMTLANVAVDARRAEEIGRSEQRETFDVAVARAVGEMIWVAEWLLPLVKPGGSMLVMKGKKAAEELEAARRAIRRLGGGEAEIHPVELPGADSHVIVRVPKIRPTDARFPRDATVAKGKSLAD